jgi:hypothetical protein
VSRPRHKRQCQDAAALRDQCILPLRMFQFRLSPRPVCTVLWEGRRLCGSNDYCNPCRATQHNLNGSPAVGKAHMSSHSGTFVTISCAASPIAVGSV